MSDDFTRKTILSIAQAFGIDYENLVADYRGQHEAVKAWSVSIYKLWVTHGVRTGVVPMPFRFKVEAIVGYDPQKLLPDLRGEVVPLMQKRQSSFVMGHLYAMPAHNPTLDDSRWGEADTDPLADIENLRKEMQMYGTFARNQGKTVMFKAMIERTDDYPLFDFSRWNESDSDPLADVQNWMDQIRDSTPPVVVLEGDYSEIEAAVLRQLIMDGEVTVLDMRGEGSLPGIGSLLAKHILKHPFVERPEKTGTYLDHDPTKNHRRRKRRGKS